MDKIDRRCRWALAVLLCTPGSLLLPASSVAQLPDSLTVQVAGDVMALPLDDARGFPAISASNLDALGWSVRTGDPEEEVVLAHRTGLQLGFIPGLPFVIWDGLLVQMVDVPYWQESSFHIPLQVVVDLFPGFLPDAYQFEEARYLLLAEGAEPIAPTGTGAEVDSLVSMTDLPTTTADSPGVGSQVVPPSPWSLGADGRAETIVIIDAGHGGMDSGMIGSTGIREKDVALSVGLALAREVARNPEIEVRLTRDRDVDVPVWTRGEWATQWSRDRVGVFVSLHANALEGREGIRGFETYFLSEARTEHERYVTAVENAGATASGTPSGMNDSAPSPDVNPGQLRAFDHRRWSALLADEIQRELGGFHPGPDRGVRQAPLTVITTTLMPAVVIELGFLSNPAEERLLGGAEFHRDAARAIASALDRFLREYGQAEGVRP